MVLVDDDRASLDLMSAYLDDAPVQVIRATDGESALELIRKVLPAAVVLDIQLPRLDGWHVLAELKAADDTAAIPVVIASVVDDRPQGKALGARRPTSQAGQSRRPDRCAEKCWRPRQRKEAIDG